MTSLQNKVSRLGGMAAVALLATILLGACANVSLMDDLDALIDDTSDTSGPQSTDDTDDTEVGTDSGNGLYGPLDTAGVVLRFYESYNNLEMEEQYGGYGQLLLGPSGSTTPWDTEWRVLVDSDEMLNPAADLIWVTGAHAVIPDSWRGHEARIAFRRYIDLTDTDAISASWSFRQLCLGEGNVNDGPTSSCETLIDCSGDTDVFISIPSSANTSVTPWRCSGGADTDRYFYHIAEDGHLSDAYLVTEPFTVPTL